MTRSTVFALLMGAATLAVAAPVPKEDDAARMVRIYGSKSDPNGDAQFEMAGEKLRILLPARELPPTPSFEDRKAGRIDPAWLAASRWNPTAAGAPRVWREITGDFTAVVRVSFPIRSTPPADSFCREPRGWSLGRAIQTTSR